MRNILGTICGLVLVASCAQPVQPYSIGFTVRPDDRGVAIVADVQGGPRTAWVGFGVGPGASPRLVDRITGVTATSDDGDRLAMTPIGQAGYQVETNGAPWQLSYRLKLKPAPDNGSFYRSSTRGEDYLVIVGSDAWARFYTDAMPLAAPPESRPAGPVANAAAQFQMPQAGADWRVVTTAWREAPNLFAMRRHPVGSVFAIGPFETMEMPSDARLRVARHARWDVASDATAELLTGLVASHREMLGPANDRAALVLLNPLPEGMTTRGGLRTAGMVRDQTLLVYAMKAAALPSDHPDIVEAMAVFLGHELFHLWVPSQLQVTRELSWLSEGWAMHMGRRAAVASGWIDEEDGTQRLSRSYRRYLDIGGYRAGSLPAASLGHESQRNLLYLRGELVFRLLEQEWDRSNPEVPFERALWESLVAAYDGVEPLDSAVIRGVLADLTDAATVRRYVEGQAPLTPAALGLAGR
jgi:hypothetical protein